jgi:arylsulfatase A-like enzyme
MASMLKSVDESFGRVLDTLDRLKLTENTIVVFNSDNGGNVHSNIESDRKAKPGGEGTARGDLLKDWDKWAGNQPPTNNAPLRNGKGTLYEGGVRVPLMWSWPGVIQPGTTSSEVVGCIDLYPTMRELLSLPKREEQLMDGVSYVSVLKSQGPLKREAYFNYFPHGGPGKPPGVTMRSGDWKLIRWYETGPEYPSKHELYNLKDDLGEMKNLAAAMPEKVQALDKQIDEFLKRTGAIVPKPNPQYQAGAGGQGGEGRQGKKKAAAKR